MRKDSAAAQHSPSNALRRFQPPPGALAGAAGSAPRFEHLRYGFRVGGFGLLIDPATTGEVIDIPALFALPKTPPWLLGLINLRGNLVPVFDLHLLFGTAHATAHERSQRLLILGTGERAVGVLIERLPEIPDLSHKLMRLPPLPTALADHVTGAYVQAGFVWLEFQQHGFFHSLASNS